MLDPTALLAEERQHMGRGVELVNASVIVSGSIEVMTLLYNCDPIDAAGVGPMYEQRVAIFVAENGTITNRTGLIAQTHFKAP